MRGGGKAKRARGATPLTVVVLAVFLAFVLGGGVALLWVPTPTPAEVGDSTQPARVGLTPVSFADQQAVTLEPQRAPEQNIVTASTGVLTWSGCAVGAAPRSGRVLARVNDRPIVALSLTTPPWRTFESGLKGRDVKALQETLNDLGFTVEADGGFGPGTADAVSRFRESVGLSTGRILRLDEIAWLPPSIGPIVECPTALGASLAGGPLAVAGGVVSSITVRSATTEQARSGRRTLTVGEVTVAFDPQTPRIGARDAAKIQKTAEYAAYLAGEGKVPLTGSTALVSPVAAFAVPPAAVVTTGDRACVFDGSAVVSVDLLTSRLGRSLITIASGGTSPRDVVAPAPDGTTCT